MDRTVFPKAPVAALALAALLGLLTASSAYAQTPDAPAPPPPPPCDPAEEPCPRGGGAIRPYEEFDKRVRSAQMVTPLASDGPSTTDGANFNRYWYANNNPYKFVDPDGRQGAQHLGCAGTHISGVCARGAAGLMMSARIATAEQQVRVAAKHGAREAGQAYAEMIAPGLGCYNNGCSAGEWAMEAATLLPIGKLAKLTGAAKAGARATTDIVATPNGLVNVRSTIDRIRAGEKLPHRNDGAIFQNREGLLPNQPAGYYREYVHPTPGVNGPGAQRIIQGQNNELYYSPDHYRTFIPFN